MTLLATLDIVLAFMIGASLVVPSSRGRSRLNVVLAFTVSN